MAVRRCITSKSLAIVLYDPNDSIVVINNPNDSGQYYETMIIYYPS
jgi:hypothetical protein